MKIFHPFYERKYGRFMPKIRNYYGEDFYLECNLLKNNSYIYDEKNKDYLNWIPMELKICIGEEIHDIGYFPTVSVESLKYFFTIRDKLIGEKTRRIKFKDNHGEEYSTIQFYAPEGDFEICFHNLYDDERDVPVVKITLWYARGGYGEGYNFMTRLEDYISFFDELTLQFKKLIFQS